MIKKHYLFAILYCLSATCVFAEDSKAIIVNADNADYDGTKITLRGSVVVDHPIGILSANDVVMTPKDGADGQLASVNLNENVALRLTGGGLLSCAKAQIDLLKNYATCCGSPQCDHVVYTENVLGKKQEKVPVIMKCNILSFDFHTEEGETPISLKDKVREITATGSVTISYNHDIIASGNKAIYHRIPASSSEVSATDYPGKIALSNEDGAGSCLVTNKCGDMVYANTVEIDTCSHHLVLENPKGSMIRNLVTENNDVLTIRSDIATWDENIGIITLKGHVEINDPIMGQLRSNDEIRLVSEGVPCKKWVRAESQGESTLVYKTPGTSFVKTLKCYGLCVLDNEKLEARLSSPKDENGLTLPDKQVFYMDEKGEIFADTVVILYKTDGKETELSHIALSGHVKILNRLTGITEEKQQPRQYILADKVDFYPQTQQMILSSTKGRRVLFYDEENDFQMSAKGVKTVRDNTSKRDTIQGSGDVRFHLVEKEVEKMRQQFSLDKITNKLLHKKSEDE